MLIKNSRGQSLLELVVGMSLVVLIVSALSFSAISGLRNSQFSKNQLQATKLAQETIEKVRTIKNSDYGVCLQNQTTCSNWKDIWNSSFGHFTSTTTPGCGATSCTFKVDPSSPDCTTANGSKPFCLKFAASPFDLGNGFTQQIIIEEETTDQLKVIVYVGWKDASGDHKSQLVTVLSKYQI